MTDAVREALEAAGDLTDVQIRMLRAGAWIVDGYTSRRGLAAAFELESRGLARKREIGGREQQYSGYQFEATDAGRASVEQAAKEAG